MWNLMNIRPVGAELFHADRWKDGRTDMTKLIVAFRNFANVPKTHMNIETQSVNKLDPISSSCNYCNFSKYSNASLMMTLHDRNTLLCRRVQKFSCVDGGLFISFCYH
jgi:hypothetical protein